MPADLFDIDLSWYQWPDFARVALVLAGVVGVVLLVRGLRWLHGRRAEAVGSSGPPQPTGRVSRHAETHDDESSEYVMSHEGHEELSTRAPDPVLRVLHRIMRFAAYLLSIAMVIVILEGVVSVIRTLAIAMTTPPFFVVPDIVTTFGAFLAVLIAYEIFSNITLYIRSDVFPVKLVVATAVMAIARKIIILDMDDYTALDLVGLGAIVIGLGVTYWLISIADASAAASKDTTSPQALAPGSKAPK